MPNLYTPMQVQELLEISATGLRIYTKTYTEQLTKEATSKRRRFTVEDLRWLAFVKLRLATITKRSSAQ
jgi:DNA-binding transcriptional MerR regulator